MIEAERCIGYKDVPRNAFGKKGEFMLTSPSKNCRITEGGEAYTRPGYVDGGIEVNQAGKLTRGWRMEQFDLTFFCVGTKIYYTEGELSPSSTLYDTGVTITNGQAQQTRFLEYAGCMISSNKTDGSYLFMVTKLNGAASSGATSLICDRDGVSTVSIFNTALSLSSFNVRINGTNEAATGTNLGAATFTGMTLSQAYADNTIAMVVFDLTAKYPKCAKIVEWENMLHFIDVSVDDAIFSSDINRATVPFTPPATATAMENMLTITTTNTSVFGKPGKITNALSVKDYLYLWTENAAGFCHTDNLNRTSFSHPISVFEGRNYGCINADSAIDIGNGLIPFITPQNRIVAIKTVLNNGAVLQYPDETFDDGIQTTIKFADDDQTNAFAYYHSGGKLAYFQMQVSAVLLQFVYDNKAEVSEWLPPDDDKPFSGYFERKGKLFGTELTDDTVYQMDVGNTDNGVPFGCVMAHGLYDSKQTAEWKSIELKGSITQDTTVDVETILDSSTSAAKTIESSDYSFTGGRSFSDVAVGDLVVGGATSDTPIADYIEEYAIAPVTYGQLYQTVLSSYWGFTLKGFRINARVLSHSLLTVR